MNTSDPNDSSPAEENPPGLCTRCVKYVREHPVSTVVSALATGMVVGWLLPHPEPTWSDRFWRRPVRQMKGLLNSVAGTARSAYGSAADYAGDAVDGVREAVDRVCGH